MLERYEAFGVGALLALIALGVLYAPAVFDTRPVFSADDEKTLTASLGTALLEIESIVNDLEALEIE